MNVCICTHTLTHLGHHSLSPKPAPSFCFPSQWLRSFSFSYLSGAHFLLTTPPPPASNLSPHPINSISQIFLWFIYFYLSSLPYPILDNNHYPISYITIPYQLVFLHPVLPPPVPSHTVPNSSHYISFCLQNPFRNLKIYIYPLIHC